ncbi:MAG: hypothetical protein AB8B97_15950 [Granulosicoccus sp.]
MSDLHTNIPEGSSLYYSMLWTDPTAKVRVNQRLELIKALVTTLDDVQEPQVAEKKIHWWHEELQRLHSGDARHPATQLNQSSLKGLDPALAACLEILSAVATQRFTPVDKNDASETNLILGFRTRLALLTHALSNNINDLNASTHPEAAALALAQHEQLSRLPGLIHRGHPVFSDEMYQQFHTQPHDLAEHIRKADPAQSHATQSAPTPTTAHKRLNDIPIVTEKPGRRELLMHAIERTQMSLQAAIEDQTVRQRYRCPPLLPVWRLLVLRKHQLDLWEKRKPDLLRERLTLTPLNKLFRAWQNRR